MSPTLDRFYAPFLENMLATVISVSYGQWKRGDNLFRYSDKIQGVSRLFKGFSQPDHISTSCRPEARVDKAELKSVDNIKVTKQKVLLQVQIFGQKVKNTSSINKFLRPATCKWDPFGS